VLPVDTAFSGFSGLGALRVAEHLHGHLGWLAALALVHPAVLLRRAERRAHLAVALATGVATLAAVVGGALYPAYRELLKPSIFAEAPALGFAFERKEHLAFGAIAFAWAGALAYAGTLDPRVRARLPMRRASHACFVASAVFALATAALGTCVAVHRTF
jgi:cytochrome c biogenesis factor